MSPIHPLPSVALAALLSLAAPVSTGLAAGTGPRAVCAAPGSRIVGSSPSSLGTTVAGPSPSALGPTVVPLQPTRPEVAGTGSVVLTMAGSPYGIAVASDGRYRTRVVVRLAGLPPREGARYVAWAATPSLERAVRLGSVESGEARIEATLEWNQFLVFVTAEADPGGERWEGPILFTAMSPSGKMHPKAGHGIFESYSYLC